MLRPLPFVAVRQQAHEAGHTQPLALARRDELVEQHLRAILDLPLGSTKIKSPSAMVNLLGEEGYFGSAKYQGLEEVLTMAGAHIHLYGKKITKPYRKMGHVTIVDSNTEALKLKARKIKDTLKIIS